MGITTSLRFGLARMLLKASNLSYASTWAKYTFLIPTFDRLVSEGYNKNATVIQCLSALTFAFSEPPVRVWSDDSKKAEPLPTHPLRQLIRNPNPLMGEDELMQYTVAYMALGGNAYWVTGRDAQGRPAEQALWPYHAGQVRPIPGGPAWITGYEYFNGDGEWERINQNDYIVTHFKWPLPDPTQPWVAQPALRAVASSVDMSNELDTYVYALLKNDAVVRTLVKLPKGFEMTKPEKDRFREQWSDMYGGKNRGGVAILDDGAGVERLGMNLQELAYDTLGRVPEARIAGAFRVPPIVAGLNVGLERSTYANYGEARKAFTEDTLVPLWRANDAEIESSLGAAYGDSTSIRRDLSEVASLQENMDARWTRVNRAWVNGLLMKNEARRAIGYEDAEDGDVYLVNPKMILVPAAQIGSAGVLDLTPTRPAPVKALPRPAAKAASSDDEIDALIDAEFEEARRIAEEVE